MGASLKVVNLHGVKYMLTGDEDAAFDLIGLGHARVGMLERARMGRRLMRQRIAVDNGGAIEAELIGPMKVCRIFVPPQKTSAYAAMPKNDQAEVRVLSAYRVAYEAYDSEGQFVGLAICAASSLSPEIFVSYEDFTADLPPFKDRGAQETAFHRDWVNVQSNTASYTTDMVEAGEICRGVSVEYEWDLYTWYSGYIGSRYTPVVKDADGDIVSAFESPEAVAHDEMFRLSRCPVGVSFCSGTCLDWGGFPTGGIDGVYRKFNGASLVGSDASGGFSGSDGGYLFIDIEETCTPGLYVSDFEVAGSVLRVVKNRHCIFFNGEIKEIYNFEYHYTTSSAGGGRWITTSQETRELVQTVGAESLSEKIYTRGDHENRYFKIDGVDVFLLSCATWQTVGSQFSGFDPASDALFEYFLVDDQSDAVMYASYRYEQGVHLIPGVTRDNGDAIYGNGAFRLVKPV